MPLQEKEYASVKLFVAEADCTIRCPPAADLIRPVWLFVSDMLSRTFVAFSLLGACEVLVLRSGDVYARDRVTD